MSTKENILKIATEEFAKYGFDAVSMNDLVKKLDINKATIYYHFKDKKSLYLEVIKIVMEKSNNNIKAIINKDFSADRQFKKYVKAVVLTIKEDPNTVPLALREIANFGANVDERLIPYIEEELNYLRIIIEKLDLKEHYKNMNIYALFAFINGSIKIFYAIQMSDLPLGGKDELKHNSEKTLNYISEFVSNIILDAIVKK